MVNISKDESISREINKVCRNSRALFVLQSSLQTIVYMISIYEDHIEKEHLGNICPEKRFIKRLKVMEGDIKRRIKMIESANAHKAKMQSLRLKHAKVVEELVLSGAFSSINQRIDSIAKGQNNSPIETELEKQDRIEAGIKQIEQWKQTELDNRSLTELQADEMKALLSENYGREDEN